MTLLLVVDLLNGVTRSFLSMGEAREHQKKCESLGEIAVIYAVEVMECD